jgi:hypothetical protein
MNYMQVTFPTLRPLLVQGFLKPPYDYLESPLKLFFPFLGKKNSMIHDPSTIKTSA